MEYFEIESIEDGFNFTVDIEVEKEHEYILKNGIVSHNSISLIHNCSSGIEPVFAFKQLRNVKTTDGHQRFEVKHKTLEIYDKIKEFKCNKNVFVSSSEIDYNFRIKMQAIVQNHINSAISSTVNLPKDTTEKEISDIYIKAWWNNLKGITIYRDGSRDNVIIDTSKNDNNIKHNSEILQTALPLTYDSTNVVRHIIKSENRKWYIFVTQDDATGLPYDLFVFTNSTEPNDLTKNVDIALANLAYTHLDKELVDGLYRKSKKQTNLTKMTRFISMLLRHRIPIIEITDALDSVDPPIWSFVFQIKKMLKSYLNGVKSSNRCIECDELMTFENGCVICKSCGYSKCD